MYQAIVFLPLLGAIVAGAIALFGARSRFPGRGSAAARRATPRPARRRMPIGCTHAGVIRP